ncbi:MAG: glycine zipper 2TM domain-containing protein [Aquabacterium sp.]
MKAALFASLGTALSLGTVATAMAANVEYGKVISKTPVYVQVAVPERQCVNQQQAYQPQTSGAGAVVGAVTGGVVGNAVGRGAGKAVATGLGVVAGAVLGDRVEADNTPPAVANVQTCQLVTRTENRFVAYDVTYDYQGQRYTARVLHDPGDRIALNVKVVPAGSAEEQPADAQPYVSTYAPTYAPPVTSTVAPAVVYSAPSVVYAAPPVVYGPPVYWGPPRFGVGFGWGWGGGYRHWR